jgi:hypothetical protein
MYCLNRVDLYALRTLANDINDVSTVKIDRINRGLHYIYENYFQTTLVKQLCQKPTPNIACTELNCRSSHRLPPAKLLFSTA